MGVKNSNRVVYELPQGGTILVLPKGLRHAVRTLQAGGMVFVLDRGAIITAEDEAMLQALHSRSISGIREHLSVLEKRGSGGLMENYYVGYGHKSIGDCGTGTVFIEGVSMLAAKAIQDWRLYSGQESSTRYIDFANQKFLNPLETSKEMKLQESLRTFYLKGISEMKEELQKRYPYQAEWDEKDYKKTISARAFDIMRGFLPAGATTNLAWSSNLRQMADSLMYLRHHPLSEVQDIADKLHTALKEMYPNSFGHKIYTETEKYNEMWMKEYYYWKPHPSVCPDFCVEKDNVDGLMLDFYDEILKKRPQKTELPPQVAECGSMQFKFRLDFGSFRDLQRHRSVVQRMPLLGTLYGFHPWYISQLSESLKKEAEEILSPYDTSFMEPYRAVRQYYIPMGFQLPNRLTGDIRSVVYIAELRATRFVHPTVRNIAYKIAHELEKRFAKHGLTVFTDDDPDAFDVKRGEQDIVKKD